jgi:hypothetical protein
MSHLPIPSTATRRRAALAALALAALLAGCGTPPRAPSPPQAPAHQPALVAFKAVLNGRDVVPPADTPAQGELLAVFDRDTNLLRWRLSFSQLSGPVRRGAFHSPAMGGELADPVIGIGRSMVSPSEGRAMLTEPQRRNLLSGQWYINLVTDRFPYGELRGQLIEQR